MYSDFNALAPTSPPSSSNVLNADISYILLNYSIPTPSTAGGSAYPPFVGSGGNLTMCAGYSSASPLLNVTGISLSFCLYATQGSLTLAG